MTRSWALQHVADGGSMIRQLTEVHPEGIQAVAFLHLEEIFCPNLWFDDKIKEATYSRAYTIPITSWHYKNGSYESSTSLKRRRWRSWGLVYSTQSQKLPRTGGMPYFLVFPALWLGASYSSWVPVGDPKEVEIFFVSKPWKQAKSNRSIFRCRLP